MPSKQSASPEPKDGLLNFESRHKPVASRRVFRRRMVRHVAFVLALLLVSLGIGMWGYEHFESLPWRDAFLNTCMLLGGMGPVDPLKTPGGKLFAGFFALYAGVFFLFSAGLLITPIAHRLLHKFHWESGKSSD
jgi:hypothetical protein